jgi:hypothetical protein
MIKYKGIVFTVPHQESDFIIITIKKDCCGISNIYSIEFKENKYLLDRQHF